MRSSIFELGYSIFRGCPWLEPPQNSREINVPGIRGLIRGNPRKIFVVGFAFWISCPAKKQFWRLSRFMNFHRCFRVDAFSILDGGKHGQNPYNPVHYFWNRVNKYLRVWASEQFLIQKSWSCLQKSIHLLQKGFLTEDFEKSLWILSQFMQIEL